MVDLIIRSSSLRILDTKIEIQTISDVKNSFFSNTTPFDRSFLFTSEDFRISYRNIHLHQNDGKQMPICKQIVMIKLTFDIKAVNEYQCLLRIS